MQGLSLVVASGGHSSSRCAGLSLSRPLLLWSTGSRRAGSVVGAHGPSCSAACGILPDQGSSPCSLHRQADSQPLLHQGSPPGLFKQVLWTKSFARLIAEYWVPGDVLIFSSIKTTSRTAAVIGVTTRLSLQKFPVILQNLYIFFIRQIKLNGNVMGITTLNPSSPWW